MREGRQHTAYKIKDEIPQMAHAVFDVISKDPEKKHVTGDVSNTAVHEHRKNQSEIDGKWRRLQTRNQDLLPGDRMFHDAIRCSNIAPTDDLLRHRREGVSEPVVRSKLLQKDEDQNIRSDQSVVNYGRGCAIAV